MKQILLFLLLLFSITVNANEKYQILYFSHDTTIIYEDTLLTNAEYTDLCIAGQLDAEMYHGKNGAHFALGMLLGGFSLIGTALTSPSPEKGKQTMALSKNKQFFSDPGYRSCYKNKAKGQMLKMNALGWATWVLILLTL